MGDATSADRTPFDDLVTAVRWLLIVAGSAAAVPVAVTLLLRQFDIASPQVVGYVAATPLITFFGLVAVILLVVARWWTGAAVAGALTVVLVLTQVPLYLGRARPDGPVTEVTMMTVNLHYGGGDPAGVVRLVRELDVDVLALEELTSEARAAMAGVGLDELLPHSVATPQGGPGGNGLWSRYPLTDAGTRDGFRRPPVAALMDVDGRSVSVVVVHPTSPYPADAGEWSAELGRLEEWLATFDGPVVVAGDFNATYDHRPFRDLLATGLRDAAEQVGTGFLPTYPAHRRRIPLLITIDHVLTGGGVVAVDVRRTDVDGTDHAGLLAVLAVPRATGPDQS
ncbi:MAG: endonuclease/exonuclease/phosphatase family protein [Ilumatobacteraceae bacterium]